MTNGYTPVQNTRGQTNSNSNNNQKTQNGETIYTTAGVVKDVFVVDIKQGTEQMYVVAVGRNEKPTVFVKILGKTRENFLKEDIKVGEPIRCRAYYPDSTKGSRDFGFDLPHPEYGTINVQAQVAVWAGRPMTEEQLAEYKANKAAQAPATADAGNGIG